MSTLWFRQGIPQFLAGAQSWVQHLWFGIAQAALWLSGPRADQLLLSGHGKRPWRQNRSKKWQGSV